jgi:hypothetical protein
VLLVLLIASNVLMPSLAWSAKRRCSNLTGKQNCVLSVQGHNILIKGQSSANRVRKVAQSVMN